jgi:hypothetical protein
MREFTVSGLKIKVPNGSAFAFETPVDMPKMHFLACCVGKRGAGKMVASINLLQQMPVDRLFYVSPSADSNSGALSKLKSILSKEDMYADVNNPLPILESIVKKIERERDEYEEYHRLRKKWEAAHSKITDTPLFDLYKILDDDYLAFDSGPPKHKWGGRIPCCVVFIDDCVGSQMMLGRGQRELGRLCLIHRHIGAFTDPKQAGAVGISLLFNVQSFKTGLGGLPPAVRSNLTLLILFRTASQKELADIAESCSGEITNEQFLSVCDAAWRSPHDFLLIDLHKKPNHLSMFRRNFDTFLIP